MKIRFSGIVKTGLILFTYTLIIVSIASCSRCDFYTVPELPPVELTHSRKWIRLNTPAALKSHAAIFPGYEYPGKSILIFLDTGTLDSFRKFQFSDSLPYFRNNLNKEDYFYIVHSMSYSANKHRTTFWLNTELNTIEVYLEFMKSACDQFQNYSLSGSVTYALPKKLMNYDITAVVKEYQ